MWYGAPMLCPERNGAGITTINRLQTRNYPRLFFRRRPGRVKGEYVMEYGWLQTNENKQIMSDDLKAAFRDIFSEVSCSILLDEAATYIRHENGRLAHEEGKFDDCVIAAGLAIEAAVGMPEPGEVGVAKRKSPHAARLDAMEAPPGGHYDRFEEYMQGDYTTRDDPFSDLDPAGLPAGGEYSDIDGWGAHGN
jgi:hypothetical protein